MRNLIQNPSWAVILFALFCVQLSIQSWQLKKQVQIIEILHSFKNYNALKSAAIALSPPERILLKREMQRIKANSFSVCDRANFYDFMTYLSLGSSEPTRDEQKPTIKFSMSVMNDPKYKNIPLENRPGVTFMHDRLVGGAPGQAGQDSLLNAAYKFSGRRISLRGLKAIAEAEKSDILSRHETLKARQTRPGENLDSSLQTLAAQRGNLAWDVLQISNRFSAQIERAQTDLMKPFKDYFPVPAQITILEKSHIWGAAASYSKKDGLMRLYVDEMPFDLSPAAFLTVHEIVPGHHLQHSAQIYSGGICAQPATINGNLLTEGWATYAEHIADEAGFYNEPAFELAWLDYRLIRVARIYLDIAMTQGVTDETKLRVIWNEQLPERLQHSFDTEYMRLKRTGHHHLSYILGRNAIREAKAKLKRQYGDRLDIRLFHDAVLRGYYPDMAHFYDKLLANIEAVSPKANKSATRAGLN